MAKAPGKKKRQARLGRGLSSLISAPKNSEGQSDKTASKGAVATAEVDLTIENVDSGDFSQDQARGAMPTGGVVQVSVNDISPNPFQPRQQFDNTSLTRLSQSIKTDGILQPLMVRPSKSAETPFELIAGERRWRAAQEVGLQTVPVIIRDLSDRESAEIALIENLQREDLNPIERAEAFSQLIELHKLNHEQVADRVGVDRSTITNALRLLTLHADVKQLIRDGLLSGGQARAIAGLVDGDAQRALAILAVKQAMSVRQVEEAVRRAGQSSQSAGQTGSAGQGKKSAHLRDLEKQLAQQLGTKVHVQQGRKKGTGSLKIEFYSLEEFDGLLSRLGVETE